MRQERENKASIGIQVTSQKKVACARFSPVRDWKVGNGKRDVGRCKDADIPTDVAPGTGLQIITTKV